MPDRRTRSPATPPSKSTEREEGLLPPMSPSQVRPSTVVVIIFTVLVVAAGLYLLWELGQLVRWMVIAIFLAVALNPAVDWLQRRHIRRSVAVLLVYLAFVLVVIGLGALVVPPLVVQVQALIDAVVGVFQRPGGLERTVQDLANRYGLGAYLSTLRDQAKALPGSLNAAAGPLLAVTRGIIGSITALLSILLLTFFLLLDGAHFVEVGLRLFPTRQRPLLRRVLGRSATAVYGYISGNLAISLVAGVAAYIGMLILRVPFAIPLALLVALLDLIPLVGATLGAAIVVIVGFFVSPLTGIILIVYFFIYQQVENNVLQPLVYGRSVRLHPLVIFLAVLAGGQLLGILGALLAIPVAEIIRIIGSEWLSWRAEKADELAPASQTDTSGDRQAADTVPQQT
ncbi:MAG TPA: AI-2E family transporter [Ktedonobacterales bacterium]